MASHSPIVADIYSTSFLPGSLVEMSHLSVWYRPLRHCSTEGLLCDSHSFIIILQNAKNGAGSHSQAAPPPALAPCTCLSELVTTNHIVTSCGCLGTRRGLGLLGPQHLLEHREA